ncbi:TPA: HNH endonuclease [Vibrio harveyi]|uniref:HNH endonuclease n=1 Tax=Vibrio TaxID=662 RepID=UPI0013001372|nr:MULTISPECIES: hypothetical protein [Vibrio]HDM8135507.1 HNH endonuclease [Vibrio harveyi]
MAWKNEDLKHPKWQRMRLKIMERDNWKCIHCGEDDKTLNVHHSLYINGRKPWEYCESDLETVCEDCHRELHKVKRLYSSATLDKKISMWHTLIGDSPKVQRVIECGVFLIIELTESKEYCQIIHAPSFRGTFCPIPAEAVHFKMLNEPESLDELKHIIMQGSSRECKGPIA